MECTGQLNCLIRRMGRFYAIRFLTRKMLFFLLGDRLFHIVSATL